MEIQETLMVEDIEKYRILGGLMMWSKNYKKVSGIVTKKGSKHLPEFEFNFEKLAEMTNHYEAFIEKVKANYEKEGTRFMNIAVFTDERIPSAGERREEKVKTIYVVFDHFDTYISLFGCDYEHEKYSHIFEFSLNKQFVSMMADLL